MDHLPIINGYRTPAQYVPALSGYTRSRELARDLLADRRRHDRASPDWQWMTTAARTYLHGALQLRFDARTQGQEA